MRRIWSVVLIASLAAVPTTARAGHELNHPETVTFEALPLGAGNYLVQGAGPCDADAPGTDSLAVVAPRRAEILTFEIFPNVDWDSSVCSAEGELLATGANILGDRCANILGDESPIPLGCTERTQLAGIVPGRTYVLLVVNFSDPLDLTGRYVWSAL